MLGLMALFTGCRWGELLAPLADVLPKDRIGLIFRDAQGNDLNSRQLSDLWHDFCDGAGLYTTEQALAAAKCRGVSRCIYPYTLHWMRHTFATICYDAGVDVKSAASMLGHANEQTTMEIYTHLTKSWEQASVEKLDAYLSQQKERAAG